MSGLGGLFAADKIKDYADAWTVAGNKIAAAQAVSGRSARSLEDINKIATETRSGITETVDLYAKLLRSTAGVAKSEQEVATATEVVNKAFKAGGAAASEQSAGILQLSQALSSGILQGDELRSIRENAPLIAQAIANEFKTTIGGLKQLGADGKLTVDRVFKAILDAKPLIDRAYGSTAATIADGFTLVNNAVTEAIGKINEVTGAGTEVGKTLGEVATIVNALGDAFVSISGSPAGKLLGFLNEVADKLNVIKTGIEAAAIVVENWGAISGAIDSLHTRDFGGEIADARKEIDKTVDALQRAADAGTVKQHTVDSVKQLIAMLDGSESSANAVKVALDKLGEVPGLELLPKRFDPLIDKLTEVAKAAADAVAETAKIAKAAVGIPNDPRQAGFQGQHDHEATQAILDKRTADSLRTDQEAKIDERAAKIVEAFTKAGQVITEAAAKLQAAKEIANEDMAHAASLSAGSAADLIKNFEGFRSKAYYDVNHYRVGYGSDTTTDASGNRSTVTAGTVVSLAEADRDLLRRIGDVQQGIKDKIGADTFNSFDQKQQAALTSIAYNYGSLPDRIVAAIKSGDQATIVQAIRGLGSDNGGVNKVRRNTEADMFLGGAPSGVQKQVKGQDRFGENLSDTQLQIDLLNKQAEALGLVNPLIEDYGYAQTKAEIAQKLTNDAMDNGVAITPELAAKIDELAGKYAKATAAGNQMAQSQENLQQQMSESSSFGKDVLGGFIRDLRDGKSATEALANALDKVADKLLDVALNSLFDGGGIGAKPGGGILGGLFKFLFPFAKGGIAKNGKPMKTFARGGVSKTAAVFGEAGAEAAVPLPDGRSIPVSFTGGKIPQRGGGGQDTVNIVLQDDSGRMSSIADQRIQTHLGTIVKISTQQSLKAVNSQMPGLMANAQARSL